MSLNFQLARGGIALVVFVGLAATALLAPGPAPVATSRVILVAEAHAVPVVCPLPLPSLRLAMGPADLPALPRLAGTCRA